MPANFNTSTDNLVGYGMDKANPGGLIENNDTIGETVPKPGYFTNITTDTFNAGTADSMVINGAAITSQIQINSDTLAIEEIHTHANAAGSGGIMYMARSRGTIAAPTIVQSGDTLGTIAAVGYDGVDYSAGATINFLVDGTPGSNDMPTKIVIAVSPDGTQVPVPALTINSNNTVAFNTYPLGSVGNALTAAGSSRTDALQLANQINNITTAAASTGVILPVGVIGMRITVFNGGANAAQVYASASETIDGVAGATGVVLTNAKRCDYFFVAANTWISAQLGVVSA